jgi:drug/metabolite transporter (DMT)-like permease
MKAMGPGRGIVYGLASAMLFGMSTPLAKTLVGSIAPLMLAGLLYAGAGLGLLLVLVVRRSVSASPLVLPERSDLPWLIGAILLGGVLGPVALMHGLRTTPASSASLLLNLEAVLTALLAWFLFRENFDRRVALGMLAIVAGGVVLAWSPVESGGVTGALLIAAACLCWAVDNNLTRKVSTSDAVLLASLKGLVAGAINTALAVAVGSALPPPTAIAFAGVVGFLGYGVSLALFVLALRELGTARAGAYFSVAPFFGALIAIFLYGDPVTFALALAGALMAVGVWLHLTERHSHGHVHEPLAHTHAHSHDEHHTHAHGPEWDGAEPHVHPHVHEPLEHAHAHYPDAHHRHGHKA